MSSCKLMGGGKAFWASVIMLIPMLATTANAGHVSSSPPFRGVNLGGWFVLESWIYPSWWKRFGVPEGVGEWQFCEQLGRSKCLEALRPLWDTWVSEAEIKELAASGITHVRIPVGYWCVSSDGFSCILVKSSLPHDRILGPPYIRDGEPYVSGQWPYLVRALQWCKKYSLGAVIDLHGAPGSQNGHDNSGKSGDIEWNKPENIARTLEVLEALAANLTTLQRDKRYEGAIVGIELLNEPWTTVIGGPIQMQTIKDFYQKAADVVLATGFKGQIWFEDGWDLEWDGWRGFLAPPTYQNVFMDTHIYKCFGGPTGSLEPWQQVNYTCRVDLPRLQQHTAADWVVVGEYSLCIPRGWPSAPYTEDDKAYIRALMESQLQAYGAFDAKGPAKGAFFWNFKAENNTPWNYLENVRQGTIPTNLTATSAPNSLRFDCEAFVA